MVESIRVINNSTLSYIEIGQTVDYELFLDSIDWGSPTAAHSTYSFPGQIGSSFSATNVKTRDIVITGYVWEYVDHIENPNLTAEETAAMRYSAILKKKAKLDALVNPEQLLAVQIGDFRIEGKPSKPVLYGKSEDDNNKVLCKFQIYLFCADPMFKKKATTETVLSESTPKFHFPLIFKPSGIVMSVRTNYQLIAFNNEGSIDIGAIFEITANGPVTDISIENIYTGEWLKITKTLAAGETVIVDTRKGERGVVGIVDGVESDYLKYWDYEGTWLQFKVGTSLVGYRVESGAEELLDVRIISSPKYYSLEEM